MSENSSRMIINHFYWVYNLSKVLQWAMIIETNSWNTAFIYSTNFDLHFQCGPGILLGIGVQESKQRCDLELHGINIAIEG